MADLKPRWERMEEMATSMQNDAKEMKQFSDSMYETSLFIKQKAEKMLLRSGKIHVIATNIRGTDVGDAMV